MFSFLVFLFVFPFRNPFFFAFCPSTPFRKHYYFGFLLFFLFLPFPFLMFACFFETNFPYIPFSNPGCFPLFESRLLSFLAGSFFCCCFCFHGVCVSLSVSMLVVFLVVSLLCFLSCSCFAFNLWNKTRFSLELLCFLKLSWLKCSLILCLMCLFLFVLFLVLSVCNLNN